MQMENIKVIRTSNNTLYIFYYSENSIYYQTIYENEILEPTKVISNVSPVFSLWHYNNDIFLIANGDNGIIFLRFSKGYWNSRIINSGLSPDCTKLSFFIYRDLVHFLYSIKDDTGKERLFLRTMKKDQWMPSIEISEIMSFHSTAYLIGQQDDKNIEIYYRIPDKTIKYCNLSIDSGNLSPSINFLATNMPCIDISTLTDGISGHLLYLAQGMFSTQLIYKGRNCDNLGKARIIWEGQYGQRCSLFAFKNRLYAVLFTQKGAYLMVTEENSSEFSIPKPLDTLTNSKFTKSEYFSFYNYFSFNSDEISIDTQKLKFPIIDDICSSFCPSKSKPEQSTPVVNSSSIQASAATDYIKELTSMSEQISQLSQALSERNEELATLSTRWKNKYDALLKESEELKKQLINLRSIPTQNSPKSDIVFVQSREL